jgi:hypothetical protein
MKTIKELPWGALCILLLLSGCNAHRSPLQSPEGEQALYLINSEQDAFGAAYDALSEAAAGTPVFDLDGPIRGYRLKRVFFIDQYTTIVRVFAGTGTSSDGTTARGYYAEVSGSGTLFDGPSFDKGVYNSILDKFKKVGREVLVSRLKRGKYKLNRDRWRLTDTPSLRDGGTILLKNSPPSPSRKSSVTKRLDELERLKAEGQITDKEYQSIRSKVLGDL